MVILTLTQLTRLAITCGATQEQCRLLISLGKRFIQQRLGSSSGGGCTGQGTILWPAGCMESEASPLYLPSHPQSLPPCWELGALRRCWAWLVLMWSWSVRPQGFPRPRWSGPRMGSE